VIVAVVRLQGNAGTVQVPVLKEFARTYINVIILKERSVTSMKRHGYETEFYAGYKQWISMPMKKINRGNDGGWYI
jgi:hypothetical protein